MSISVNDRYVDLLMGCLTRELFINEEARDIDLSDWPDDTERVRAILKANNWRLMRRGGDPVTRSDGKDWPPTAETMVGRQRLDDVRQCVNSVLADGVPGDFIETGVWRGGVTILMRGLLAAWGDTERCVWVADSFKGLPAPNAAAFPQDVGHDMSSFQALAISANEVRANFARYGLLDGQVKFLEGWFQETLPSAPIKELSILRLDGDMYESTMDALEALYPKLAIGGYVLVDDYGAWPNCRQACNDYRSRHGIKDKIISVDWTGVHWRRTSGEPKI